jgi:hypothetical protein
MERPLRRCPFFVAATRAGAAEVIAGRDVDHLIGLFPGYPRSR